MAKYKIVLNRRGVRQLLRSKEMKNICAERAFAAQNRLGEGYEVQYYTEKTRAVAEIRATTHDAVVENFRGNTILKALK